MPTPTEIDPKVRKFLDAVEELKPFDIDDIKINEILQELIIAPIEALQNPDENTIRAVVKDVSSKQFRPGSKLNSELAKAYLKYGVAQQYSKSIQHWFEHFPEWYAATATPTQSPPTTQAARPKANTNYGSVAQLRGDVPVLARRPTPKHLTRDVYQSAAGITPMGPPAPPPRRPSAHVNTAASIGVPHITPHHNFELQLNQELIIPLKKLAGDDPNSLQFIANLKKEFVDLIKENATKNPNQVPDHSVMKEKLRAVLGPGGKLRDDFTTLPAELKAKFTENVKNYFTLISPEPPEPTRAAPVKPGPANKPR